MNKKSKIAIVIAAGAVSLGGISQATTLGTQNEFASVQVSKMIQEQTKVVDVDYSKTSWIDDPLQTVCGVNCFC